MSYPASSEHKLGAWSAPEPHGRLPLWGYPPCPTSTAPRSGVFDPSFTAAPAKPPPGGVPASSAIRESASLDTIQHYLALRRQFSQHQQCVSHPGAAQSHNNLPPGGPVTIANPLIRRSKRGKPMARRSLQALFDAAASSDTSTWGPSGSSIDTEDDAELDTACGSHSAASSQSELSLNCPGSTSYPSTPLGGRTSLGPETPPTFDSGLPIAQPFSCSTTTMTSTTVPLRSLLDAPRGRCITSLEAKAVLYRMADDLATLHSERIVHRRVSLDAAQLTLVEGYAAVALPSGNAAIRLPIGTGSYIAPREANVDAAHLPPEAAGCHQDRTVHTCQGDMWAFGVAAFQLLTNGALPFDVIDLAVLGGTVDDMQNWIDDNLKLALCAYLTEPGRRHHECVGIDNHAATMLAGLLRADPAQRLTAIDVLQHPWLSDVVDLLPKAAVFAAMQVVAATPLRTNTTTATKTHSSHGVAASSFTENSVAPVPIANDGGQPQCPYPLIGHVARPVQVRDSLSGEVHTMSALHTVYEVPGNGPMMSANPVKMVPLETVACLVAGQHAEASLVNGAQGRCTALA